MMVHDKLEAPCGAGIHVTGIIIFIALWLFFAEFPDVDLGSDVQSAQLSVCLMQPQVCLCIDFEVVIE